MSDSEMAEYIAKVRQEVSKWPEWKKKLLPDSLNPYRESKRPMSDSEQKLSSYIHWEPKPYRVTIRKNWPIKPEAKKIDGKVYLFRFAWLMDDSDQYPNEVAMVPHDDNYPKDAPIWIASGDLAAEGDQ